MPASSFDSSRPTTGSVPTYTRGAEVRTPLVGAQQQFPNALRRYLELDLSEGGTVARDFLKEDQIEHEAQQGQVYLYDIIGTAPTGVTTRMGAWYQEKIQPRRSAALKEICELFLQHADDQKDVFLLEARQSELDEKLLEEQRQCYRNREDTRDKIVNLEAQLRKKEGEYKKRKAELQREAKPWNRSLYFLVLVFVIFGSEAAINLDAFMALSWATPAIAWGSTILVGFGLGLAADFHGTLMKQYEYHFGAAEKDTRRGPALRMLTIGVFIMLVSLSYVGYARDAYFMSQAVLDQDALSSGNLFWILGGSLLGNVLVYSAGTLWAYIMHDPDPDYMKLKKDIDKKHRELNILKRHRENAIRREMEVLEATHERSVSESRNAARTFMALAELREPRELFNRFKEKDAEVIPLLIQYRRLMIQKMGGYAHNVAFVERRLDDSIREINVGEFAQKDIKLKYL